MSPPAASRSSRVCSRMPLTTTARAPAASSVATSTAGWTSRRVRPAMRIEQPTTTASATTSRTTARTVTGPPTLFVAWAMRRSPSRRTNRQAGPQAGARPADAVRGLGDAPLALPAHHVGPRQHRLVGQVAGLAQVGRAERVAEAAVGPGGLDQPGVLDEVGGHAADV